MAEPVITFGTGTTGFGALDGWDLQNSSSNLVYERANVLNNLGNESNAKAHNDTIEVSATYKANVAGSAPVIPEILGVLTNVLIPTGINVSTIQNDFATMVITGHNHATNAHSATPALQAYTHGITLDDGFGVTDHLGGELGDVAGLLSSSVNIVCDHVDRQDEAGDHLVGNNFNARIEASASWAGVPTTTSDGSSWEMANIETPQQNVDFLETNASGVQAATVAA